MDKNSNVYVLLYSLVMVILVAVLLAFTSQSLKDRKKDNENIDQMRQILGAVQVQATNTTAIEKYESTIVNAFLVDQSGEIVPESEGATVNDKAFNIRLSDIPNGTEFPVFVAEIDGNKKYILGMHGTGLWGPIWGYISLEDDGNTVYGVNLSHASETPGLGAEIALPHFTDQFVPALRENAGLEPLQMFKDGDFKSVRVVKGGRAPQTGADYVDGISGGTITSKGVDAMLYENIQQYVPFLQKLNS